MLPVKTFKSSTPDIFNLKSYIQNIYLQLCIFNFVFPFLKSILIYGARLKKKS